MSERKPDSSTHYLCERCGGTGKQEAGCYNIATKKYDSPAGTCEACHGSGCLGVIQSFDPSKIDPRWVSPMQEVADMIERNGLGEQPHG